MFHFSKHGFWTGYEKINGSWQWLDGNKSNFTFWGVGHPRNNRAHVMVNEIGEWISVDNGKCAYAVCTNRGSLFIVMKLIEGCLQNISKQQ